MHSRYVLRPVGIIRSALRFREDCPKQGREDAPEAWLEIDSGFADAIDGIAVGSEILILTWPHKGRRDLLSVIYKLIRRNLIAEYLQRGPPAPPQSHRFAPWIGLGDPGTTSHQGPAIGNFSSLLKKSFLQAAQKCPDARRPKS